ncbi:MAG: 1-acyl-sn-glycerol-3-phosphate acyltransferase [Bosea sp. (in: a-proteobacteria)]
MIEMPVWFVVLAGLLALIGLIDRLLVPTVRWMLRRRFSDAIDELNTRLKLRIQPFKLTRRESLIDRMVYDQELMRAVEAHAAESGEPRAVTMARVKAYAREIVPTFNAWTYFSFGAKAARWLSNALYRVRLGYFDEEKLKLIDADAAVVFVINHRSNMDYVLVTYLAAASSALSYAVGEWARVVFLQTMIRSMGAYFIRRDSGDPLYRKVLARYVQIATAEGVTQAVFPEGGLTRDGALRPAKLGLLSYITGKFDPGSARDLVFVPVGLNYDRVLEDRTLTGSLAREAGEKQSRRGALAVAGYLRQALWLRLTGRWHRFGYASVSFGEPLSLRAYLAEHKLDLRDMDDEARFAATGDIAALMMRRIAAIVPVLPVPLIATVFDRAGDEAMSRMELMGRVQALIETLTERNVHVHIPRRDIDYAVEAGLRILTMRHLVLEEDGLLRAAPKERVLIRYYANSIAHHLGERAIGQPLAPD